MKEFLLSVAGFDPTGGAGILRDCLTFRTFGFLPCGVITANTVQNTKGVSKVSFVDRELLLSQLRAVLSELPIKGIKLGLPHESLEVNGELFSLLKPLKLPVVFDPVLRPTFGASFVKELSAVKPLLELSTVITPNYEEFLALSSRFPSLLSKKVLVVKGIPEGDRVKDALIVEGKLSLELYHEKDDKVIRGTGCAFSSALLSLIAKGRRVEEAFREAVDFMREYRSRNFKLEGWKQFYPSF
ncbi:bifunctional hydroxymethylpyrimidine kinase/phosphomethylpyrimidine kinase [Thermovibrio sp.]